MDLGCRPLGLPLHRHLVGRIVDPGHHQAAACLVLDRRIEMDLAVHLGLAWKDLGPGQVGRRTKSRRLGAGRRTVGLRIETFFY